MGRFPPGLPLIPGFLWDFWHPSAGPVGSSQGQQGGKGLDLNRYESLPSRPSVPSTSEVPRTGSFQNRTLPSETDGGSPTTATSEQNDQWTWPEVPSRNGGRP
jgi:hypothetical protein